MGKVPPMKFREWIKGEVVGFIEPIVTRAVQSAIAESSLATQAQMEQLMSNIEAAQAQIADLKVQLTAAADRISADVAELESQITALNVDAGANAGLVGITASIKEVADGLRAIDPLPDFPPVEPPPVEPPVEPAP